jgi:hypothetical protein
VLSTRPLAAEDLVERLNREHIPVLRQVVKATKVTGSRATMTATELQILTILYAAGIASDGTTP